MTKKKPRTTAMDLLGEAEAETAAQLAATSAGSQQPKKKSKKGGSAKPSRKSSLLDREELVRDTEDLGQIQTENARLADEKQDAIRNASQKNAKAVALEQIKDRAFKDLRELDPEHVVSLASSIAEVDLIQPIAVDANMRLLAGAHRRAALRLLALDPSARADFVNALFREANVAASEERKAEVCVVAQQLPVVNKPVLVRIYDYDSSLGGDSDDPAAKKAAEIRALAVETAENEKRKNFSKADVKATQARLEKLGYRIFSSGRPSSDDKDVVAGERLSLLPALAGIFGVSIKTIRRNLTKESEAKADQPADSKSPITPQLVNWINRQQRDTLLEVQKMIKQRIAYLDPKKPSESPTDESQTK